MPSPDKLWQDFLDATQGKLSGHVLDAWLRGVRCTAFDGRTATLEVRDQWSRDWLTDHYSDFITSGLSDIAGLQVGIAWHINSSLIAAPEPEPAPDQAERQLAQNSDAPPTTADGMGPPHGAVAPAAPWATARNGPRSLMAPLKDIAEGRKLNPRYLFDAFVCGPSNQFAFAACRAAAQNPGRSYNPLFVVGGVGLGKTHLLSAIGHQISQDDPHAKVIYVSSEQFTNEVINAVLGSKLDDFRAKYRRFCDVILIDDIQLIAGKERTQHEFFHIFNTLYDSQRQIVVTSDKLPHEIPDIEERLRNRFVWGLIADVQPPEIETRVAILRKKALTEGLELNNEVAFFLARNVRSNVRELEGALVRIMAHASLSGSEMTLDYARNVLADIVQGRLSQLSVESIQKAVAKFYQVRVSDLKSASRVRAMVKPRQMAMFLCRKHIGISYPELGSKFGNKDHTTVLSACTRIEHAGRTDPEVRGQLDELERQLA